jgi:hypothetical protein
LAVESSDLAQGRQRALQLKANLAVAAGNQETFLFHGLNTKNWIEPQRRKGRQGTQRRGSFGVSDFGGAKDEAKR